MEQTFEQALSRLEEVVDTIENGETSLESALSLYKEGLLLSKTCGEMLNRYEAEITLLQKDAEGVFSQKPFPES